MKMSISRIANEIPLSTEKEYISKYAITNKFLENVEVFLLKILYKR